MSRPSRTHKHAREGDGSPAVHRLDMTRYDLTLLIDALHLRNGVEVGVDKGYFSHYLLRHSTLKTLLSVDSYSGRQVHYEAEALANLDEFRHRSRLEKATSADAARAAQEAGKLFDFVYIDAAHDEASVESDIAAWFPLTARPCVFAGHDYVSKRSYGVIQAVNRFASRHRLPVFVTKEGLASWFFIIGAGWRAGSTLPQQKASKCTKWNVYSRPVATVATSTPPITFVHALWGDLLIRSWCKVLVDIQQAIAFNTNWYAVPGCFRRMVFAYGVDNYRFLQAYGLKPIKLCHHPLKDFRGIGDRTFDGRNQCGEINFGYSIWEHKSHAIQQAFERGAEQIIWLDWDTVLNRPDMQLFAMLEQGPEFQGRIRLYNKPQRGIGSNKVYHGGCYYARSPSVFVEIDRITPIIPLATDETRAMIAVQNLFFDGKSVPADEHRKMGFDNPYLYRSRGNAVEDDVEPIFREGGQKALPPFVRRMKTPNRPPVTYDVMRDKDAPISRNRVN